MVYTDLRTLLANELEAKESEETLELIRQVKLAWKRSYLTKAEFLAVCRWKSPRAIRLCQSNSPSEIRRQSRRAFTTRNERIRLEALTSLRGVGVPMASAILTLTNPQDFGVIDIRVWQFVVRSEVSPQETTGRRI